MKEQLGDLNKDELIAIIQDYQEMVSEIEHELNVSRDDKLKPIIREILAKYLWHMRRGSLGR